MDAAPELLLGLPVLDAGGARLGTVVDVGLGGWRRAKFVVVRDASGRSLLRVELQRVAIEADALRLRPAARGS